MIHSVNTSAEKTQRPGKQREDFASGKILQKICVYRFALYLFKEVLRREIQGLKVYAVDRS
jgi:hypothetical protein